MILYVLHVYQSLCMSPLYLYTGTVTTLNLTVVKIAARIAFLRWDNFKSSDPRQLLSYVISWKEA